MLKNKVELKSCYAEIKKKNKNEFLNHKVYWKVPDINQPENPKI